MDAVPDSDAVGSDDPVDRPFGALFPIVAIDWISNSFGQNQQDIIKGPKSMATSFTHSHRHQSSRNQPWHQCRLRPVATQFAPFFLLGCAQLVTWTTRTRAGHFPYTQAAAKLGLQRCHTIELSIANLPKTATKPPCPPAQYAVTIRLDATLVASSFPYN